MARLRAPVDTRSTEHRDVMGRRREWFERLGQAYRVLWWIPAGRIPTLEEAKTRLQTLRERGPSPEGFTFRAPFPSPGNPLSPA
ncbi:MAG: DUF3291 domain-containing protein [Actinomycetota bacterium]|nr:DUF3291 domain-containing protein [Actinomycetota bacterium]